MPFKKSFGVFKPISTLFQSGLHRDMTHPNRDPGSGNNPIVIGISVLPCEEYVIRVIRLRLIYEGHIANELLSRHKGV